MFNLNDKQSFKYFLCVCSSLNRGPGTINTNQRPLEMSFQFHSYVYIFIIFQCLLLLQLLCSGPCLAPPVTRDHLILRCRALTPETPLVSVLFPVISTTSPRRTRLPGDDLIVEEENFKYLVQVSSLFDGRVSGGEDKSRESVPHIRVHEYIRCFSGQVQTLLISLNQESGTTKYFLF